MVDLDHASFDSDLKNFLLEEPLRKSTGFQQTYTQPFPREVNGTQSTLISFRRSVDSQRPVKTQQGVRRTKLEYGGKDEPAITKTDICNRSNYL